MRKRGIFVACIGIGMLVISLVGAGTIINKSDSKEFSIANILEGMFDQVTEKTHLQARQSVSFTFDAPADTKTLMWGIQIIDYKAGDKVDITVSNIYGDVLGKFNSDQAVKFETMKIEKSDTYTFNVENKGTKDIDVIMMFTKNPEESARFQDPNSPFSRTLVPLATLGILMFAGFAAIIIGVIITVIDYRKKQSEFT